MVKEALSCLKTYLQNEDAHIALINRQKILDKIPYSFYIMYDLSDKR